ncbi:DUF2971 domain-containing protein [Marinifilum sp. D737]|uniref:DUF2971 domain-containing protein n=1 Tax=Marinifilum sp. D737 TaxID=2969628 RepID=UPI002274CFBA|nr:DUF2971 domain-containing protein [Marinifilum sp. D737]MCY1634403.1 DUF2971 domain-containing protein [Marinifilum sp. D737]
MKKLYHYTSINNLALILKSGSIRFGRLDYVNDPTEGKSDDFHSLSSYIFISCWTENEEENLALWNMYTPDMNGVRIELEIPLFESYKVGETENLLFSKSEFLNEQDGYFIVGGLNEPYRIEYTDDIKLLQPSIRNTTGLHVESLAKCKRSIWKVEQECRYRLDIYPVDKTIQSEYFPDRYQHLIDNQTPPPIEGYMVKIKDESFRKMKIRFSPKLKNGDKEIVHALVNTYNGSATIQESSLKGLIR